MRCGAGSLLWPYCVDCVWLFVSVWVCLAFYYFFSFFKEIQLFIKCGSVYICLTIHFPLLLSYKHSGQFSLLKPLVALLRPVLSFPELIWSHYVRMQVEPAKPHGIQASSATARPSRPQGRDKLCLANRGKPPMTVLFPLKKSVLWDTTEVQEKSERESFVLVCVYFWCF